MGTYRAKVDRTEEQGIRELLTKDGYSEVVIDHWLNPRNLREMKHYDGYSEKITSSCGDSMWFWVKVKDNVIENATYVSDICIGAVSSGSTLTEIIKGKTITEALWISPDDILRALGGLPENLAHCAALAEMALKAAIKDYNVYKASPWKRFYQIKKS